MQARCDHRAVRPDGFTVLEMLLAISIVVTAAAIAVPLTADALDEIRTAMAARYLEGRIVDARMHAVKRAGRVGLRFEPAAGDYRFAEYLDGNGNGIRTAEIAAGIDPEFAPARRIGEHFPGVRFGLRAGVPDVDGARSAGDSDGVRIGASRILSLGPDGTATAGTLYLRGRRSQYAVRVLGATGRTRVLRYDAGVDEWITR
jgi:prepilin-type N-terminal cleavage/methylation domain-containing protein